MSVTFSQVYVAPMPSLGQALERMGNELFPLRFSPRGRAWSFQYNIDDNDFEDTGDAGFEALALWRIPPLVDKQGGLGLSFQDAQTTLSVRVARQPDGTGICFVDMSDRDLYRFFQTGLGARLRTILAACGQGCAAPVSFGGFELEWCRHTTDTVLRAIEHGPPEYEGRPPPFGLLRKTLYQESRARMMAGQSFDVHAVGSYWCLQRKDVADTYASIER